MGKIEIKQIPSELHPSGDRLLKIAWDDKEPPKDCVWAKGEDDYYIWDGKKWIPYEFELINDKRCVQKNCGCITKEELVVKFDKFKKDVLAAVLKMNQTQDATNIADIRLQLYELRNIINQVEELENYYTKEEIDEKTTSLTNITNLLNGSVGSLTRRITGIESNFSDILAAVDRLNQIDHTQFVTARDVSGDYEYDTDGHIIIDGLEGYATEEYVNRAISNLIGGASSEFDTLKELSDALENKVDKSDGQNLSDLISRIEDLENNPATDTGIITRIETLENKPFDEYLTEDEALVISTSLNDLNDRVVEIEKTIEDDEFVVSKGLNDLNNRLTEIENTEASATGGLDEQEELLIAAAFNDLNNRVSELEESKVDTEPYIQGE